ncbi:MAG TPA: hypothetical protein VMF06_11105 [Candidatus Limnocylindria bacterium]|nr:hypothetical protein [Candidatus Limnocylindria bacterium]
MKPSLPQRITACITVIIGVFTVIPAAEAAKKGTPNGYRLDEVIRLIQSKNKKVLTHDEYKEWLERRGFQFSTLSPQDVFALQDTKNIKKTDILELGKMLEEAETDSSAGNVGSTQSGSLQPSSSKEAHSQVDNGVGTTTSQTEQPVGNGKVTKPGTQVTHTEETETKTETTTGDDKTKTTSTKTEKDTKTTELPTLNSSTLFHSVAIAAGSYFLSPYSISLDSATAPTKATLDNSGSTTSPFIEFAFLNRCVLNPEATNFNIFDGDDFAKLPQSIDIESHVGFTFRGSTQSTNFSASTIAGGGDFYGDFTFAAPLFRRLSGDVVHQVTLEASGGVVTEKTFIAAHPNAFAGLGYEVKVPAFNSKSSALFEGRIGYGWLDIPDFLDSTRSTVRLNGSLPQFDLEGSPTMGTFLAYPIGKIFLTVSAQVYFRENPAPWSIRVGTIVPIEALTGLFSLPGSK